MRYRYGIPKVGHVLSAQQTNASKKIVYFACFLNTCGVYSNIAFVPIQVRICLTFDQMLSVVGFPVSLYDVHITSLMGQNIHMYIYMNVPGTWQETDIIRYAVCPTHEGLAACTLLCLHCVCSFFLIIYSSEASF